MVGIIFLFVGVVLLITGSIAYFSLGDQEILAKTILGSVMGGLGSIFSLIGIVSLFKRSKRKKIYQQILQTGVSAEGSVVFVDKNYSILVNQKPIYSIIEYTYKDYSGMEYTNRITDANSDTIIRQQIKVGSKIAIKYSSQNSAESIVVL